MTNISIKKKVFINTTNFVFGKKSSNKIIVFQSDDWGSERMANKSTYDFLKKSTILEIDKCPFSRFDTIENNYDINRIANSLLKFKDRNNNSPNFTINTCVTNPDFNSIKNDGFNKYSYVTLSKTYDRNKCGDVINSLVEGERNGIFDIQYHGRQHFHVGEYMNLIKTSTLIKYLFDLNIYAISFENSKEIKTPYLATYFPFKNYNRTNDFLQGLSIFYDTFKKNPESFIAPVYIWNDEIEKEASKNYIKSIQGLYYRIDYEDKITGVKKYRYRNKYRILNTYRNCFFEPSLSKNYNWIDNCLFEISNAFYYNKPAIISTHRLNYVSGINSTNADENLELLERLLYQILKFWPNVIFSTTTNLKDFLQNDKE